jgi:O-antigen/teichoic acid export membrane protein
MRLPGRHATVNPAGGSRLVRNTAHLFLATGVTALFGFVFWIVVARTFSRESVGLATTLLSMSGLISLLGLAGFDTVFVGLLAKSEDRSGLINTGLCVSAVATAVVAGLFCALVPVIAPRADIVDQSASFVVIFVVVSVLTTWNVLTNAILIAHRRAEYVLGINIIFSAVKMVCPVVDRGGGPLTLFVFMGLAQTVNVVLSVAVLMRTFDYTPRLRVRMRILRSTVRYAATMYLASLLDLLPDSALPLIVLDKLGAVAAAYFYICFTIASVLYQLVFTTAQSLLAEMAAAPSELAAHLRRGTILAGALIVPAAVAVVVADPYVLGLFGPRYAHGGTALLRLMSLTALVIAPVSIIGVYFKAVSALKAILVTTATNGVAIIALALWLAGRHGLTGVGVAWLIGTSCSLVVGVGALRVVAARFTRTRLGG